MANLTAESAMSRRNEAGRDGDGLFPQPRALRGRASRRRRCARRRGVERRSPRRSLSGGWRCSVSPAPRPGQHRRHGGDDAGTFSADPVWKAAAEGRCPVGLAGRGFLGGSAGRQWSLLTDCVRTGKPAGEVRDPNVPSRWSQEPEAASIFRAVMGTAPAEDYAPIASAWDFSRANVVADLGGGGGSLILAVLELHPHLRGMLVDREESVEAAKARFADEKVSSRCRLVWRI